MRVFFMAYSPASSSFPTSKTTFVDPTSTNDTSVFDHAGLESAQNDAIEKLETAVGITASADANSLNYKLTNASSSDPGHTHTASSLTVDIDDVTPTTTKGDIIVEDGSNAVRLAVGSNGQVLTADSAQASGVKWASVAGGGDMSTATYDPAAISEQLVGLTATQTLTNKTLTTPTITLKQSTTPTPTTEGDIQWDTDNDKIVVGDGSGQKTFSDDSSLSITASQVSDFDTEVSNNTSVSANTTHISSDGSDHSFIDQDVTSGSGPTFTSPTIGTDIKDTNGNVMLAFNPDVGANNYLRLNNSNSASPFFEALGASTDINVAFFGKGAGVMQFNNVTVATISDTQTLTNKDISAASNTFPSATTSATGDVELATTAEVNTGTDTSRAITPDALAGSNLAIKYIQVVLFDFTTDCATGDGKAYAHIPAGYAGMNLVEVHAECITAGTTGTMDIQIHNVTDAVDMLSTKLTIDSAETGSDTAATPAVIDTANDDVAENDLLRCDVDAIHTTAAKGLIVTLGFQLP